MGIPGILAAATHYLQAISAGELVTELLLLMFLANVGKLTLEAASVVSLRIRLVATGAGGLVARSKEGGVVLIGSSFVILRFSARSAGPPQLITHSCIVAKLFSFPRSGWCEKCCNCLKKSIRDGGRAALTLFVLLPLPILFSLFMDDEGYYGFMFIRYGYRYRFMCF